MALRAVIFLANDSADHTETALATCRDDSLVEVVCRDAATALVEVERGAIPVMMGLLRLACAVL